VLLTEPLCPLELEPDAALWWLLLLIFTLPDSPSSFSQLVVDVDEWLLLLSESSLVSVVVVVQVPLVVVVVFVESGLTSAAAAGALSAAFGTVAEVASVASWCSCVLPDLGCASTAPPIIKTATAATPAAINKGRLSERLGVGSVLMAGSSRAYHSTLPGCQKEENFNFEPVCVGQIVARDIRNA